LVFPLEQAVAGYDRMLSGKARFRVVLTMGGLAVVDWQGAASQSVRRLLFDHEPVTLRTCVNRRQPFGRKDWQAKIAATLGLESTMRQRRRQRKLLEK